MSLKKLDGDKSPSWLKKERCRHIEHDPPGFIVLEPGTYEHLCPSCGHKTVFTVPEIIM